MTPAWPFWLLLAASAACAIAYGVRFLRAPPTLLRAAVKTGGVGFLALALYTERPSPLVLALAFGALGDLALAFDKKWTLPLGIFFFLLNQLLYLAIFVGLWIMSVENLPAWASVGGAAAIGAFVVGYLLWLAPKLGALAFGVVPYALAIGAMAAMSLFIDVRGWPAMLGAFLFLVSDGVLAAEIFRLSPDSPARKVTSPVVWWTYVAAQALIVLGVVLAVQVMA